MSGRGRSPARRRYLRLAALAVGICVIADGPARSASPHCGQAAVEPAAALGYCLYPGRGPLLVLLSGLGNDLRSWSPSFLEALSRMAGVLVYDRRGHGRSAALEPRPVIAEAVATDLHRLLQALRLDQPVVLVGHSLGGLYAQYFARTFPQQVAAVVLIDAASPFEPIDDPRFATRASLEPGTVAYFEDAGVDGSILQTRDSPALPPIPLIVLTATDHRSPPDFEREWQQIQAQVAAQSPLGRQVIAEGSGHDIQDDRPGLVVEQIDQLLRELRAAPP
ncbi:MAG: alpha/beta fold hydrolase [Geminicoccaceae bacterium]